MTVLLGLTGSIGMGKSTTAHIFASMGVPVWDADAAVHRLYAAGGAAVGPLAKLCPKALQSGAIQRDALKSWIAKDPTALSAIEAVVHPLVAQDRATFLQNTSAALVVLDIPLLFEKGTEAEMDTTLLVTAPKEVQRARVLARAGMTVAQFETILARQMPDAEKRKRADHIVETLDLGSTTAYVKALIEYLKAPHA